MANDATTQALAEMTAAWAASERELAEAKRVNGALLRALLAVEFGLELDGFCPKCGQSTDHDIDCTLDKALELAGLPDQASRDEARARIAAEESTRARV